jgi:hypothetical protein
MDDRRYAMLRRLMTEVELGRSTFQAISQDAAIMIGLHNAEQMSVAAAEEVNECFDELEQRGMIEVLSRSSAGFIHVDRLTRQGRDLLNTMRSS